VEGLARLGWRRRSVTARLATCYRRRNMDLATAEAVGQSSAQQVAQMVEARHSKSRIRQSVGHREKVVVEIPCPGLQLLQWRQGTTVREKQVSNQTPFCSFFFCPEHNNQYRDIIEACRLDRVSLRHVAVINKFITQLRASGGVA
jgi:hypothetical protein